MRCVGGIARLHGSVTLSSRGMMRNPPSPMSATCAPGLCARPRSLCTSARRKRRTLSAIIDSDTTPSTVVASGSSSSRDSGYSVEMRPMQSAALSATLRS